MSRRLVDRLSSLGLVERAPSRQDRRVTRIALTDKGPGIFGLTKRGLRNSIKLRLFNLPAQNWEELVRFSKKNEKNYAAD